MTDGGFESATASGNTAPGWTGTTTTSGQNTIIKGGSYPHLGTNYGNLGGTSSGTDTLTQTVAIPAGSSPALSFWANIVTQETTTSTVYDTLAVEIHNSSGTLLSTPLTLSNLNATSSNNANGTYFQPASVNLSAYAGQTIKITFRASNDSTLPTTFRIDDISLNGATGGGGGDTTPPTTSISTPANGATVSGTVAVSASGADNVGVTKLELYVDGTLAVSATSGPLSYSWNTTLVSNGSHTLVSKAYDAANNVGTSSTVTVTVSNGGAQQLIGNPGFENGATTAPWTGSSGVIDNSTQEAAHTGSWKAWLDGYGSTHTDTLSQQVAIPSSITTATLTFWLHVDTAETTTSTVYDTLSVQIQSTSGTVLATLATYSNLNAGTGYTQKSFDLAAYKGQTVKIVLVGTEDSTQQTSFVVDDFALNVQ
jgi:Bacterial Ig domain